MKAIRFTLWTVFNVLYYPAKWIVQVAILLWCAAVPVLFVLGFLWCIAVLVGVVK